METPIATSAPVAAAPAAPAPATPPEQAKQKAPDDVRKEIAKRLKADAEKTAKVRDEMANDVWKTNVEYRLGKPFKEKSDKDRVSVPVDWSFTKAKEAGMFSQVPQVILVPKHPRFKEAVPLLQKELNTVLTEEVRVAVPMEESAADVINAAGLAGVMCGYIATFKDVEIPSISEQDMAMLPPVDQDFLRAQGHPKMLKSKKRVDCRFYAKRLSPKQLLWSSKFKGSDFDDADYVGYEGTYTWAEALREFGQSAERPNGLTEGMKATVCGGSETQASLTEDDDTDDTDSGETVSYTRIFYWAARQDPNELRLDAIRQLVFVNGVEDAIIDEDLRWQQWNEQSESFIGLTKFPLRFCTLTYISDKAIPPSDSEMGRPMVDSGMRSRSQMQLQRDRSAPIRWGNVNRIDPMIMQNMMTGDDYQRIIPVNGDGTQAIGEVARANYPQENWEFDKIDKQDLMEAWQVGPNQTGLFNMSGRTAAEANIVQSGFATRQAKERAKFGKFFCSIAETIAGLMQLFYDGPKEAMVIGDDGKRKLDSTWDRKLVSGAKFTYTIREDSTVKLDSQQRLGQAEKFLNLTGKSGFVNVQSVVEEMATLSGFDPAQVIVTPNPPVPEPPNVSLRASGEDLANPVVGPYIVSLMQKGHPVQPADIEAAKALLVASSTPPAGAEPGAGMPGAPPPAAAPTVPPGAPPQAPQPPENYGPMERVTKRINEPGG